MANSSYKPTSIVNATAMAPFIVLSVLTGLISAFINPIMSYFLVEEINAEPMWIGVYTISVTLCGLVVSQYLGHLADKGISTKKLYMLSTFGIGAAMLTFAHATSFIEVLLAGLVFMALGAGSVPQMLTISRQWADTKTLDITKFNSSIRAAISLAWIIGPPIAFFLIASIGFSASFYTSAGFVLLAWIFLFKFVPDTKAQTKSRSHNNDTLNQTNRQFNLIALAVLAGSSANIMYSSSMPLFLMNELNLPAYLPGVLMGLVAAIEIPIMLFTPRLSVLFGRSALMLTCFLFATIFYGCFYFSTQAWQLIALQIVNAVFYGLFAGIGLTLLQEQLPDRVGYTSAIYSNAIKLGVMVGSTGAGLFGQFFSFQAANIGAGLFSLCGLIAMFGFVMLNKQEKTAKLKST